MSVIVMPGDSHSSTVFIHGRTCPVCGREHSVFMRRRHHFLLFILLGGFGRRTIRPMCTRCVRRDVATRAAVDMLCGNFVWFFMFFPFSEIPQFAFSFWKDWCVRRGWVFPLSFGKGVWKENAWAAGFGTLLSLAAGAGWLGGLIWLASRVQKPEQFWGGLVGLVVAFWLIRVIAMRFGPEPSNGR